jgi:hypothetical protein
MANPIAVPGTVVPIGAAISPGGASGLTGPNVVSAQAGNQAVLGTDNLIYVPDPTPVITSVRLRSFNAAGNPNFEVDQRTCGTGPAGTGAFAQDRWSWVNASTTSGWGGSKQTDASPGGVLLPGTNFCISSKFYRFTVTAQETGTVPAGDRVNFYQVIEGCILRELIADVSSITILVRSSVATSIGLWLQDLAQAHSLTKLVSVPTANVWTTVQLPNIPVWPAGGTWAINSGVGGYILGICLLAGATYTSPANDVWQNGNFMGAVGQSNFAASPVNSTFDIAFVQHEPGPKCTQLMDLDFVTNYDRCLRYFAKSYEYATKPGTAIGNGSKFIIAQNSTNWAYNNAMFHKPLAKSPTMTFWAEDGTGNSATSVAGGNLGIANNSANSKGLYAIAFSAARSIGETWSIHYTADTGW